MNFAKKIQRRNMRRAGLTLIELVMVLVILTALAALVVPQVDYLRRTSDKATASFVMEQVVENIGMFRSIKGDYPKKLDALLSGDGTADATDSTGIALSSKITSKTAIVELDQDELDKMDDMIATVMVYNSANDVYRNFPGNTGNQETPVNGTQRSFRVITNDDIIDSVYPQASLNGTGVYPNLVDGGGVGHIALGLNPDGVTVKTARLITLGVGPANEAVGQTMVTAPNYMGVDGMSTYSRFLTIFAVYDGFTVDKRPQLKGAMDSAMDFLNQEIIEVLENTLD